jgi:diaminopimelate decarboxylase
MANIVEAKTEQQVLNKFLTNEEINYIIKNYGTPTYVIDENTLHKKVNELLDAYSSFHGSINVAYSIKANFNPALLKVFIESNIMFDITSIGELYFYNRCNGNSEKVIYTTISEEYEEYLQVLNNGISKIVVSSYNGLLNLAKAAMDSNKRPNVLIRVNPEVGVEATIKASYKDGKFGVPFYTNTNDNAEKILKYIINSPYLQFEGFHFHLGSQITEHSCFLNALTKLDQFIIKMQKVYPSLKVNTIDIGGGTPVFYGKEVPAPSNIAKLIMDQLNHMAEMHSISNIIVESGRYLTAESMMLISKVVNIKEYNNDIFAILDSGYHLLLDAALLKQEYPQEIIYGSKHNNAKKVHLAGRLCDTYDVFPVSNVSKIDNITGNSFVIFYNVGAYSIVFNMPFHCQTKPAIVMKYSDGTLNLVRKRQSIEELFEEEYYNKTNNI